MSGCWDAVTVEGTLEDWQLVLEKVNNIAKLDLEWRVTELCPIIAEIINTKSGEFNQRF
jgi:hypothetical protein